MTVINPCKPAIIGLCSRRASSRDFNHSADRILPACDMVIRPDTALHFPMPEKAINNRQCSEMDIFCRSAHLRRAA